MVKLVPLFVGQVTEAEMLVPVVVLMEKEGERARPRVAIFS